MEERLNIQLPIDYKEFLKLTNGFNATSFVEPQFMNTYNVNYLRVLDSELIKLWCEFGNKEIEEDLMNSILVGGIDDEQYFLLIQPNDKHKEWRYWKFAHWIPGEHEFPDFKSYWLNVLDFSNNEIKNKRLPNNRI